MKWTDTQGHGPDDNTSAIKELFMQEVLENLTDAFFVVDHEWRLSYINHMAEAWWGCTREDLLGRVFQECFPEIANLSCFNNYKMSMRDRIPVQWESEFPEFLLWTENRTYPTQDGGLAVFLSDITEKKRVEEVVRASRDRQSIMLKLSDSLRLLDNANDIHEAAACIIGEYLGVDKAFYCDVVTIDDVEYFQLNTLYSTSTTDVMLGLHPIDSPGVLASENYAGRKIVVCDMESDPRITERQRISLRKFMLGAWISVPLQRNGRFVASFTVHQTTPRNWTPEEISLIEETTARTWAEVDRVRAEEALRKSEQNALRLVSELENADRNKTEFINALSHELRNPLAAITASLSMLDMIDGDQDSKHQRSIIRRQTDQLCHMVDDLLDLTRITNNKIQLHMELMDLNELARASVFDHRLIFEEKGVALETELSDAPLYINADPVRISQIIGNLLNNARKFTEKGGKAKLSTFAEGAKAVLVVEDNGIGIDSNFLTELFEMFRQADHHRGGLGLGLSIVKGLIQLHGGYVGVDSGGLNRGAKFTVKLPRCEKLRCTENETGTKSKPAVTPLRILLVDDNRDLVETSNKLLTRYGYTVAAANTGKDGIEKAKAFLPHVIICDIGLPDINGYEVARRISRHRKLTGCYLISLSGYAQASDIELSKAAGFALHIRKPMDFENLRSILESIPK